MTYTFRNNPWLAKIDEAAVAEVVAERIERKAHDDFLLAHAARSLLERRLRQADSTAYGAAVDRTGKVIASEEVSRVEAKLEEAQDVFRVASVAFSQAAGRLNSFKKNSEIWEREQDYWKNQARDEAARTPAERAARERREAQAAQATQ